MWSFYCIYLHCKIEINKLCIIYITVVSHLNINKYSHTFVVSLIIVSTIIPYTLMNNATVKRALPFSPVPMYMKGNCMSFEWNREFSAPFSPTNCPQSAVGTRDKATTSRIKKTERLSTCRVRTFGTTNELKLWAWWGGKKHRKSARLTISNKHTTNKILTTQCIYVLT